MITDGSESQLAAQPKGPPDAPQRNRRGGAVSRRTFLGGAAFAALVALAFHDSVVRLLRTIARAGADEEPPAGPLADHERNTLVAFGQVLIPSAFAARSPAAAGDAIADGAAAVLRAVVDEHATDLAFRAAVELLDGKSAADSRKPFAALDIADRRGLVRSLLAPYQQRTLLSSGYYYVSEDGRRIRRLWSAVAKPLIVGFYTSSPGWQVVDYPRRPGQCSNLIDYQFPIASAPVPANE